ncbi:MAG: hypothetical protein K2J20_05735 [Bacilli bacterium]|nr:hypothetical protein [Bacilli bacterium]
MKKSITEELIESARTLAPGETKRIILNCDINGHTITASISEQVDASLFMPNAKKKGEVISFAIAASPKKKPQINGSINKDGLAKKKNKGKFHLIKSFVFSRFQELKRPEQDYNYYIDEQGYAYKIDKNGARIYLDTRNPELVNEYPILVDENGQSWEYVVLEGGIIGKFRNADRTIIEVEGHCYLVDNNGINYDCEIDLPPIRR